jgi:ABC-type transport system involved in multi-copper enzyme maturation permease subunit
VTDSDWLAPLGASVARMFDLSLGQMLWSRRSVFLAVLAGVPVAIGAIIRAVDGLSRFPGTPIDGVTVFGYMMWLLYIQFIVPVLGVFYGTALIADEVEDKTLTYLFTRPIPRRAVLFGKYLAYVVCTVLLVLPSIVLVFFLVVPTGGGSLPDAFPLFAADLGTIAIGLAAYGALFALVGARMKRPLVIGLLIVFGWEPGVLVFPGYLKRLTVMYYLQGLVRHEMPPDAVTGIFGQVFRQVPSVSTALVALAVITMTALWVGARVVETREYVLEQ